MTSRLRVLVEQPTRGKRWVAVAADWPGLERGGKTEDEAVKKLAHYVPRYLPVAKRVRLGSDLATQTDLDIIGRYKGVGSTDFWGISFAPSPLDREPFDAPLFERKVRLLRAAWAEFDETAARVSAELRLGVRGGGRSRDKLVRHVMATEGGDFSKRVKAESDVEDLLTPGRLARHRDRFVEAMRAWYIKGNPLGNWTIPYLLRHTAYHVTARPHPLQGRRQGLNPLRATEDRRHSILHGRYYFVLRDRVFAGRVFAGRVFARLCPTAAFTIALSACSSSFSFRKTSIARDLPKSCALKSFFGSGRLEPAENAILTLSLRMIPTHTCPSCDQTAEPSGLLGRFHFTSSAISGSASWTSLPSFPSIAPRQSGVFAINSSTGPARLMSAPHSFVYRVSRESRSSFKR